MGRIVAAVLQILGVLLLVLAGVLVDPVLGVAVAGAAALAFGVALESDV